MWIKVVSAKEENGELSVEESCFHKGIYSTVYDKTFGEKVSFLFTDFLCRGMLFK